jgi:hypothetical protein
MKLNNSHEDEYYEEDAFEADAHEPVITGSDDVS